MQKKSLGFTLIELLVVIGIIAIILALVMPNFMGMRQRARDVKRKTELGEIKTALRLYYNDYQNYPGGSGTIDGCGTDGGATCPVCATADFAAGGADGCNNIYMKKFPDSWLYYVAAGDDFCLMTTLENPGDTDATASQTKCATPCDGLFAPGSHQYLMCAD
jgi:prepilin-type N-terminal cleavage/methylation domain-containing protein